MTEQELARLAEAQRICDDLLEPNAERVDQSGLVPRENLESLAAAGLADGTFGGDAFRRGLVEALCGACGTTYFVLIQHLGSCGQLANSANPSLRERFLAEMITGKHYVGVGFGHLRRPQPMLRATPVDGGWLLNGTAPWVTGWPVLSATIYGAHLPDDKHIYLYVPATLSAHQRVSAPLPLCAMNATETVEATLTDLFVPESDWVRDSSPEQLAASDTANLCNNVAPMFGVTQGSIRLLRQLATKKPFPVLAQAADALESELAQCRERCFTLADGDRSALDWREQALQARAWAIELGVRAAHTGVAAASGGANSLDHPAQRRMREAMFYTLFQQTSEILQGTVARLARLGSD
ncbi:acyl-CoA dehydrogenase family protein [Armatimonas rosea]|uniref:Alkylation response protein AidB-like acyl-CoA dehydrogenase n=1 Tax=Armatimonas rosea TaxID=685828 RepID=A0A7W9ST61_ARMRO|nr:alkylation response protein AidB-like acyl-CoA dehydrogenase [Armatimonas rosea]